MESAEVCRTEQTTRILVVDDESEVVDILADSLRRADPTWDVVAESDPVRAIERLHEEAFDCLVTDLVMPRMDGFDLAKRARSAEPEIALIAVTGQGTFDAGVEALRLGFSDILKKPFDAQEIQRAVCRTLRRRHQTQTLDARFAELAQANARLEAEHAQLTQKLEIASHDLVLSSKRMARQLDDLALTAGVARTLLGVVELEDLLGLCAELVGDQVPCQTSTIALVDAHEEAVGVIVRAHPEADTPPALCWLRQAIRSGVMCRAIQTQKSIHIEDVASSALVDKQEKHFWKDGHLLVVPIPHQNQAVGVAVLHRPPGADAFHARDVQRISRLVEVMGAAVMSARSHHQQRCRIYASLEAIVEAVESRDPFLMGHSARVLAYAQRIAEGLELSQPQIGALQISARLHDLGRVIVPESATNHPGPLTDEQWAIVRRHPEAGAALLQDLSFFGNVAEVIRAHHESFDGTGYPDRIAGEEIPVLARVLTLADALDAMTSPRPYRAALSLEAALDQIQALAGSQFDPALVDLCRALPIATLRDIQASHR